MRGEEASWTVGELARIARVTVRTLHYYDEIGLLCPSGVTEAGYRLYGRQELERLHLVRLYRDAGLPLETIRSLLDDAGFDLRAALRDHRARLVQRLAETEALVRAIDHLLAEPQTGETMRPEDRFDGMNPHEEEAEQRWGKTSAYAESHRRTSRYREEDWRKIREESLALEAELAAALEAGLPADSDRATAAAEAARAHIDRWFYPCDRAMHVQLGEMYVADERFAAHYERRREGLAAYVRDAIAANARRSD